MGNCKNCAKKSTLWEKRLHRCHKCGGVYKAREWDVGRIEKFAISLEPNKQFGHVAVYGEGPNQLLAACVPEDGTVVIYNVGTQKEVKRICRANWQPAGLAFRADGSLYVGDTNCRILVYSPHPDLELKHSFGKEGYGEGQLDWPVSMAFTSQGYLLVAETGNERVQVLRDNGEFVQFLEISPGGHGIAIPGDVCVAPSGHILVASLHNGLMIFDSNFRYVGRLDAFGLQPGPYQGIHCVAVSFDGTVVVANHSRVKVFRRLLSADSDGFKVTGGAENAVIQPTPIGTDMGELKVVGTNNICMDNNGNIFTANGHDIIKIPYN